MKTPKRIDPTKSTVAAPAQSLDKRLLAYAAVAGAGLLAASPAGAAPVVVIPATPIGIPSSIGLPVVVPLDLDEDGTDDFFFRNSQTFNTGSYFGTASLVVYGAGTNLIDNNGGGSAVNLSPSQYVGNYPGNPLVSMAAISSASGAANTSWGYFLHANPGHLGVTFQSGAGPAIGFIRMNVNAWPGPARIEAEITGWGYDLVAATGPTLHVENIPEPSTLSLLGLGIVGLAAWRRRRKAETQKDPA